MCLYPKLIRNPKYKPNKKNGGIIPPITDERVLHIPVGCQECIECRKQKARAWQVRLLEDIKEHRNGKFITLTFSDEAIKNIIEGRDVKGKQVAEPLTMTGYELDNEIAVRAVRWFLERWRKEYGKSLRHWFVTELGHNGTENIHLHGIVWTDHSLRNVEHIWQYGYVWKGVEVQGKRDRVEYLNYVSERTVNYIIKYVTKQDNDHKGYKSRILTSAGIGGNYTKKGDWKNNSFNGKKTVETYRTRTGHKINMPIYWRNKIYSEEERELLWLQRLDKQERWVLGVRVDISKSDKGYLAHLKQAREKNKRLGYGSDYKDQDRIAYEEQRRELQVKTRLAKARAKKTDKERYFL